MMSHRPSEGDDRVEDDGSLAARVVANRVAGTERQQRLHSFGFGGKLEHVVSVCRVGVCGQRGDSARHVVVRRRAPASPNQRS